MIKKIKKGVYKIMGKMADKVNILMELLGDSSAQIKIGIFMMFCGVALILNGSLQKCDII